MDFCSESTRVPFQTGMSAEEQIDEEMTDIDETEWEYRDDLGESDTANFTNEFGTLMNIDDYAEEQDNMDVDIAYPAAGDNDSNGSLAPTSDVDDDDVTEMILDHDEGEASGREETDIADSRETVISWLSSVPTANSSSGPNVTDTGILIDSNGSTDRAEEQHRQPQSENVERRRLRRIRPLRRSSSVANLSVASSSPWSLSAVLRVEDKQITPGTMIYTMISIALEFTIVHAVELNNVLETCQSKDPNMDISSHDVIHKFRQILWESLAEMNTSADYVQLIIGTLSRLRPTDEIVSYFNTPLRHSIIHTCIRRLQDEHRDAKIRAKRKEPAKFCSIEHYTVFRMEELRILCEMQKRNIKLRREQIDAAWRKAHKRSELHPESPSELLREQMRPAGKTLFFDDLIDKSKAEPTQEKCERLGAYFSMGAEQKMKLIGSVSNVLVELCDMAGCYRCELSPSLRQRLRNSGLTEAQLRDVDECRYLKEVFSKEMERLEAGQRDWIKRTSDVSEAER
ncbi:hypothetical protein L228DRAFT_268434 [Xylona heveae TC161]|uniref:Uncharacterized protein n=1 Tax=Xylona heveae (strain CBS 132557 / TC161) TaxID=1328760 RepID=A0A161TBM6_XYLHT|nr:hypothetical protein L228DRAFT_268434 [Xylona heveae TC161]KZF23077.1 hypothetical protein L228DRAFT_268434 [Xylona heveae TC161]